MEEIKANLDRFEEGYAVIYCDDGRKFDVPTKLIPEHIIQGSRVIVRLEESGRIIDIVYDNIETRNLEKQIKDKLERLKHGNHLK